MRPKRLRADRTVRFLVAVPRCYLGFRVTKGVVVKSAQHAKLIGISIHASFVLVQTLTPDVQNNTQYAGAEVARLALPGSARSRTAPRSFSSCRGEGV